MSEQGEVFELPDTSDPTIRDMDDGSSIVTIGDDAGPAPRGAFFDNLVDEFDTSIVSNLTTELLELIEEDKKARKRRSEQYEEGIRRTGVGGDAPGGAQFVGASKAVHPVLGEAAVDFSSRVIKEVMPPGGPAKDKIVGKATPKKLERAKRKMEFMNWQLTEQIPSFRRELEQLFTQLPIGGVQYLKFCWDARRKRPEVLFIPLDKMHLPYSATDFYSATRKTHEQDITELEFQRRVATGMYRDVDLIAPSATPDRTKPEEANDKAEGKEDNGENRDGERIVYECYVWLDLKDPELGPDDDNQDQHQDIDLTQETWAPYVISIDETTKECLSIYRNWDPEREVIEEIEHIVEFAFIPWRGAYPIGLIHLIGSLAGAATGAMRALLDTAHMNNAPTLLKLKGGGRGGQTQSIAITQVNELEGSMNTDDIRKVLMPVPFNEPSAVLFQLLSFAVDTAKGVVRTTLEEDTNNNKEVPVGTQMARMEEGMQVYSAIHGRTHTSMARCLKILHRLDRDYLDDKMVIREIGEPLVTRADFQGPMDIIPVSDPNIFNESQRFAQVQAVAQRSALVPHLYDQRKVEELILSRLKLPNPENLLVKAPVPLKLNAVNENVATCLNRPIVAFPDQDHLAHLQVHLDFMKSPMFGQLIIIGPSFIPPMLQHIKEHLVLYYVTHTVELLEHASGEKISDMMSDDPEIEPMFDQMLAAASHHVIMGSEQAFKGVPAIIQQAIEFLKANAPSMPQDPKAQVQEQEVQRKSKRDEQDQIDKAQDRELETKKLEVETDSTNKKVQVQIQDTSTREAHEDARTSLETTTRHVMNQEDNETAKEIASAEIAASEKVAVSTGTGVNPGS